MNKCKLYFCTFYAYSKCSSTACKTQNKCQLWKFSVLKSREKSDKEFVMRLVFDPRVGLKRFITSLKNLFNPTPGSNTSRITNSLPLFYLLNHTLNFHNLRLFCVLQYFGELMINYF